MFIRLSLFISSYPILSYIMLCYTRYSLLNYLQMPPSFSERIAFMARQLMNLVLGPAHFAQNYGDRNSLTKQRGK